MKRNELYLRNLMFVVVADQIVNAFQRSSPDIQTRSINSLLSRNLIPLFHSITHQVVAGVVLSSKLKINLAFSLKLEQQSRTKITAHIFNIHILVNSYIFYKKLWKRSFFFFILMIYHCYHSVCVQCYEKREKRDLINKDANFFIECSPHKRCPWIIMSEMRNERPLWQQPLNLFGRFNKLCTMLWKFCQISITNLVLKSIHNNGKIKDNYVTKLYPWI